MSDEQTTGRETEANLAPTEKGGAIATYQEPELGTGFEDVTAEDLQIPFFALLQDNSPQRKKKHDKYVEGAEEGMILNTATDELYSGEDGVLLVPVHLEKATVEWKPRDEDGGGGGFVARHPWAHPEVIQQKAQGVPPNKWRSAAGNVLKRTYYLWCLIIHPDEPENLTDFVIVSFESTKIKVISNWLLKAKKAQRPDADGRKHQVPLYEMLIRLGSQYVRGDNDYYNYTLGFANASDLSSRDAVGWKDATLDPESELAQAAVSFRQSIVAGVAKMDDSAMNAAGETDGDDDIPF